MSALDQQAWLSDDLWTQVRPAPARFRVTISVAILVAVVGAVVLAQIGFFHSRIGASYDEESARGNRLVVVFSLYDAAQVPVHVTGFRTAQPGARIVSSRLNAAFPPAPDADPAPDGTFAAPFTVSDRHMQTVTLVYVFDCSKLRAPLRINIETRNIFGHQTSTTDLDGVTGTTPGQVCPGG